VHNLANDWGLVVRAVVLTVPNIWVNFLVIWDTLYGLPEAAAITHFTVQTKRVHAKTKNATN
jgi:energy-converting hydrogenase Eha subunit B